MLKDNIKFCINDETNERLQDGPLEVARDIRMMQKTLVFRVRGCFYHEKLPGRAL